MAEITMMTAVKWAVEDLSATKEQFTVKEIAARAKEIPGFENAKDASLKRYVAFSVAANIIKKTGNVDSVAANIIKKTGNVNTGKKGLSALYSLYDSKLEVVVDIRPGRGKLKRTKFVFVKRFDPDTPVKEFLEMVEDYLREQFDNEMLMTNRVAGLQDALARKNDTILELQREKKQIEEIREELVHKVKLREEKIKAMENVLAT
jgi:hypothetical protein